MIHTTNAASTAACPSLNELSALIKAFRSQQQQSDEMFNRKAQACPQCGHRMITNNGDLYLCQCRYKALQDAVQSCPEVKYGQVVANSPFPTCGLRVHVLPPNDVATMTKFENPYIDESMPDIEMHVLHKGTVRVLTIGDGPVEKPKPGKVQS